MAKIIAICGLDCGGCPAYIAYTTDDQALRKKTAEQWAKDYGAGISADMVNCVSCAVSDGVHIGYCFECGIRKCGLEKKVENCAVCVEYPCALLIGFHEKAPQAKANLEALRHPEKQKAAAGKTKKVKKVQAKKKPLKKAAAKKIPARKSPLKKSAAKKSLPEKIRPKKK